MKKYYLGLMAVVAGLSACNESAVELTPQIQGEGVYATIEQPAVPVETKSLNWSSDNSLKFTWASSENVVVFGDGDAALLRSKTAGETSTKLESKGFDLKEGVNYYAFIPSSTFNIDAEATKVPVTFLGQRQTANNSTAHLKNYDYACASATVEEGKSLSFNLANQVAWIVLQHSCKQALNNVTSLTFSVPDKVFISTGKLDVTVPEYYKYSSHVNSLTLDLGAAGKDGISFGEGELMRVFLTVNPVDLTGKKLTITANLKDGSAVELFNATLESANITRNTPAIITTEGSADVKSVASVNGVEYSSLQGAINSVYGIYKPVIKLLDDIEGEFEVNDAIKKSFITIDLNGKTISSSSDSKAVVTVESGDLVLRNGNIKSENFVGTKLGSTASKASLQLTDCNVESLQGAVCTGRATGSNIRIYGGTFSAANNAVIAGNGSNREGYNTISLNPYNGKAPVINASVVDADAVACGIYAPWKDLITIKAAEINVENGVGILSRGGQITIEDAVIKVTGGDRTGKVADGGTQVPCKTLYLDKDCNYPALPDAYIRVKGGKYSDKSGEDYLYDRGYSYPAEKNADGLYEVVVNEDVFKAAYNNATEGGTVSVDYNVTLKSQYFGVKKGLTLALSDNATITAAVGVTPVLLFGSGSGNSIVKGNGIIVGSTSPTSDNNTAIYINSEDRAVTIEDNVVVKGGTAKSVSSAVEIHNGKLVINGGSFISGTDSDGNNSPAIYLLPGGDTEKAELEINGGLFESVSGNAQFLINCDDKCISRCKISIKGGIFVGWNPAESNADVINGKPANWVADGYVANKITYEGKDAWKVEKAQTVSTTQDFNDALSSASAGDAVSVVLASNATVELTSGVANEGSKAHDITIEGDGTQTFDVVSKSVDTSDGKQVNYQRGSSFTLKNLKIKAGEETYAGIICDEITLVNCVITEGKLTLYGKVTFVECTFENEMKDQYSIWTWGGTDVKFENCTFNTNGKAILLYGGADGHNPTNLMVNDCIFNDRKDGALGKAAIEIGDDYNATYNLVVNRIEVNGFAEGKNTGSKIWANKKPMDTDHLSVTIDGEKVY